MRPDLRPLGVFLAAVSAACGDLGARQEHFVIRDSAGIEIVENQGPRWRAGEEWRISSEPLVSIGELEGAEEYQLFQVSGAVRLADGRIVVANGGTQELRFYDPSGTYLRSAGRRGGGPGEFESLSWIRQIPGDSLAAYDFRSTRFTILDSRGEIARTFAVSSPAIQGFPQVVGLTDGRVLFTMRDPSRSQPPEGLSRDSLTLMSFDPETGDVSTLGRVPGPESFLVRTGESRLWTSPAFGRSPQVVVRPGGYYFGSTDSYEIGFFDPAGTLRRLVRRSVANRPVEASHIAAVRDRALNPSNRQGAPPPGMQEMMEKLMAEMVFPATFPAFRSLTTDDDGNLWVREYAPDPTDAQEWTVFDPAGRMLGMIEVPAGTSIHHIGADFILAAERDDLDVEYVRLYRLIKS